MMKHCIIVKWNSLVTDKKLMAVNAKKVFEKLRSVPGIHEIKIYENVIERSNRFDLMICIEMDKEILHVYDESSPHVEWKQKFGKFVENKAVFDYED